MIQAQSSRSFIKIINFVIRLHMIQFEFFKWNLHFFIAYSCSLPRELFKTHIGCVKIRTNFNLNFLLYCASARGYCWRPRKPDASSKQSYSQNGRDIEIKYRV